MATYTELVTRIEVATVKLENDVIELDTYTDQIQDTTNSAIAVEVNKAKDAATQAQASAAIAKAEADAIKAIDPVTDAPKTGSTYGRNNGDWVLVESGGGGVGTVVSVNGVGPDAAGDVKIAIPTKTSQLTNDSDFATVAAIPTKASQLTNDSAFITVADVPVGEAPVDGKQYARKDAAWSEVVSSGGGGGASYELPNPSGGLTFMVSTVANTLKYGNGKNTWTNANAETIGSWTVDGKTPITTNPWQSVDIRCVNIKKGATVVTETSCEFKEGYDAGSGGFDVYAITTTGLNNIFDNTPEVALTLKKHMLPGSWYIDSFPALPSGSHGLGAAKGKKAILTVQAMPGAGTATFGRKLTLETFGNSPTANSQLYVWDDGQKIWKTTIV